VTDPVRRIADAVLYEGYILWPYRRSATKNQKRWTFGGVYPRAYSEARGGDDPWLQQTQCLLHGDSGTRLSVTVRFLHVVERRVGRRTAEVLELVDELVVGDERYLAWDESRERELAAAGPATEPQTLRVAIPGGSDEEALADAGALVRAWRALEGAVEIEPEHAGDGVLRVTVRISNTTPWPGGDREEALRQTFVSTHTVLRTDGAFVSLTDPPPDLRDAAEDCRNIGTWPVLVGEEGDRRTVLSSPIILPDYPRIAPESPGDLFDGTEIDELLTLNILALTEEEQREMRDSDPRARQILERTAALTPAQLMRLHGAVRELRPS
jgi:hypothetical protein